MGVVDRILNLPSGFFVRLMRLGVTPSGEVLPGLWVLRTGTANFYVYCAGEALVAMDSGYGRARVRRELGALGIAPQDVTHVFLTHSDFDHARGARLFTNAAAFIARAEGAGDVGPGSPGAVAVEPAGARGSDVAR